MQGFILKPLLLQREMHFISSLNINFGQSQWSMKGRSRTPGHGVCSKSVSSTIMIQGFILPAVLQRNALYF